jgi:hypothetical protein
MDTRSAVIPTKRAIVAKWAEWEKSDFDLGGFFTGDSRHLRIRPSAGTSVASIYESTQVLARQWLAITHAFRGRGKMSENVFSGVSR